MEVIVLQVFDKQVLVRENIYSFIRNYTTICECVERRIAKYTRARINIICMLGEKSGFSC